MTPPQENYLEKEVSTYLNVNKHPGDTLFVFDGDVIHYYWTRMPVLTRYAFPIHLITQKYAKAFTLDQKNEILSILNQKPTWIIMDTGFKTSYRDSDSLPVKAEFFAVLNKVYSLQKTIKLENSDFHIIEIYKRNKEQ